jgi:hypothetical protein
MQCSAVRIYVYTHTCPTAMDAHYLTYMRTYARSVGVLNVCLSSPPLSRPSERHEGEKEVEEMTSRKHSERDRFTRL